MDDIDILILEARILAVLDKKVPIYYKDTPERKKDCQSQRAMKFYQRDILRMAMARDHSLIDKYEKED